MIASSILIYQCLLAYDCLLFFLLGPDLLLVEYYCSADLISFLYFNFS